MRAFILAAGVSRRLYPHTYNIPKCLLKVGNKCIIDYQLQALEALGINKVTMIVGYHREMLKAHVTKNYSTLNFSFLTNHHYFETNTAYSVSLGKDILRQDEHILIKCLRNILLFFACSSTSYFLAANGFSFSCSAAAQS